MSDLEDGLRRALRYRADQAERAFGRAIPSKPRKERASLGPMILAIVVTATFIAGVVGAGLWLQSRQQEQNRPGGRMTIEESSSPSASRCDPPSFRPTYLPWLESGEQVPPPERVESDSGTGFVWFRNEDQRWEDVHVSLFPLSEFEDEYVEAATGQFQVRGATGYLVWIGDPGVGPLSLRWTESPGQCGSFDLALLTKGFSESEAVSELKLIAGSLSDS